MINIERERGYLGQYLMKKSFLGMSGVLFLKTKHISH